MKTPVNLPLHTDLGNAKGLAIDARVRHRNLQHWQRRHFHRCTFAFVVVPLLTFACWLAYDTVRLALR